MKLGDEFARTCGAAAVTNLQNPGGFMQATDLQKGPPIKTAKSIGCGEQFRGGDEVVRDVAQASPDNPQIKGDRFAKPTAPATPSLSCPYLSTSYVTCVTPHIKIPLTILNKILSRIL